MRLGASVFLGMFAVALGAGPVAAGPADWDRGAYRYAAVDVDVAEVLRDFARNQRVGIDLADGVDGVVSLPLAERTPRAFLDAVASRANLLWYFDGVTLHVAPASASETRLLELKEVPLAELKARLDELSILDPRFPLRATPDGRMAAVAGPPVYVELVAATLRGMGTAPMPRVFRGRNAAVQAEAS